MCARIVPDTRQQAIGTGQQNYSPLHPDACSRVPAASSVYIFRMVGGEPLEERQHRVGSAGERIGGSTLKHDRIGILGILGGAEADRPRVHVFVVYTDLRGARFCRDMYLRNVEKFHGRVFPVRRDGEAHAFAHDLEIRIGNVDADNLAWWLTSNEACGKLWRK